MSCFVRYHFRVFLITRKSTRSYIFPKRDKNINICIFLLMVLDVVCFIRCGRTDGPKENAKEKLDGFPLHMSRSKKTYRRAIYAKYNRLLDLYLTLNPHKAPCLLHFPSCTITLPVFICEIYHVQY